MALELNMKGNRSLE